MYNDILKLFYERNEYKHFFIGSRKLELFVSLAHKSHSMIKVLFRPKKKKRNCTEHNSRLLFTGLA